MVSIGKHRISDNLIVLNGAQELGCKSKELLLYANTAGPEEKDKDFKNLGSICPLFLELTLKEVYKKLSEEKIRELDEDNQFIVRLFISNSIIFPIVDIGIPIQQLFFKSLKMEVSYTNPLYKGVLLLMRSYQAPYFSINIEGIYINGDKAISLEGSKKRPSFSTYSLINKIIQHATIKLVV